jgi:hypothetical protein
MHKTWHRNLNMKYEGNVSLTNSHHNSTSESKDHELTEMSETEFRSLLSKIIRDLKKGSNKQIN